MKRSIFSGIAFLTVFSLNAQNAGVRVAEVQFNSTIQEGVSLSGTYGEGIVNSEAQGEIIIVQGLYSGIVADTVGTGVKGPGPLHGLQLFPNPARSEVVLTSESRLQSDFNIDLISENGIELHHWLWQVDESQKAISLATHPSGIYFVRVRDTQHDLETIIKIVKLKND